MTEERSIILHVGAPKCGSSALQAALSAAPDLRAEDGTALAYTASRGAERKWSPVSGRLLKLSAARSVHGYTTWANLGPEDDAAQMFQALDRLRRKAGRATPVVSNESWLTWADAFAAYLPGWFDPDTGGRPVEVFAFVRPPLDWLNAAYWQWGVWTGLDFQTWLDARALPYVLGSQLARWAALDNTRLDIHASGDVLAAFSGSHGVDLPRPAQVNASMPPALIGFLLRNRRYREDAHSSATDFIVQRWCRIDDAPRAWAILPRHVPAIRQATRAEVETLFSLMPEARAEAARRGNPRWISDEPYHDRLVAGRSRLDRPEELAQLYRALCRGVALAAEAAGRAAPQLQPVLSVRASVQAWDVAVARALEHLIAFDTEIRTRRRLPFGK